LNRLTLQQRRDRTARHLVISALVIALTIGSVRGCQALHASSSAARDASPRAAALAVSRNGITMPILGGRAGAWRVMTPCAHTITIAHATLVPTVDVVIDPGHGGEEAGAAAYGIREADINLAVARDVQHDLEREHITAALTRTGDYRLPIPTRADIVRSDRPKLFVSIHHNSGNAASHRGPGTEVYYQHASPKARRLAGLIWQHLYGTLDRYQAHWVGAGDAGAIYRLDQHNADYYGVLRRIPATPAVLVEASYLDEPTEAALLRTSAFLAAEATGITAGIRAYLESRARGAGFHTPFQRTFQDNGGGGGTYIGCKDPPIVR
jgi:N-acetylmuramoyl-L-alanine amidase